MVVGLNYYLQNYCHADVSWFKNEGMVLPLTLPVIFQKVRKEARCPERFFLNYCTFGYTMPWWQWSDWQWFIDWMALNGVNMPLAITGQEAIWYKVWKKFGLTLNK
jgi:alpha-N-acetylglucosaminidase